MYQFLFESIDMHAVTFAIQLSLKPNQYQAYSVQLATVAVYPWANNYYTMSRVWNVSKSKIDDPMRQEKNVHRN